MILPSDVSSCPDPFSLTGKTRGKLWLREISPLWNRPNNLTEIEGISRSSSADPEGVSGVLAVPIGVVQQ